VFFLILLNSISKLYLKSAFASVFATPVTTTLKPVRFEFHSLWTGADAGFG